MAELRRSGPNDYQLADGLLMDAGLLVDSQQLTNGAGRLYTFNATGA